MVADTEFRTFIVDNINYWQLRVNTAGVNLTQALDSERENLLMAIQYGLEYANTIEPTAQLISTLFRLIQERYYWADWQPILITAIQRLAPSNELHVQLKFQLAQIAYNLQKPYEAIAILDDALALAQALNRITDQISVHIEFSNAYLSIYQYEKAETHIHQAQQLITQTTDAAPAQKAIMYNGLGLAALNLGRTAEAIEAFSQTFIYFEAVGNIKSAATALSNLGMAYLYQQQPLLAKTQYELGLQLLENTSFELEKTRLWSNKGVYYCRLDHYKQAENCFRQANSAFLRRSSDFRQQAIVLANLGYTLTKLARPSEAVIYLSQAKALWEALQDELQLGNIFAELGRAHLLLNQYSVAKTHLHQAQQYLKQFNTNRFAQAILSDIEKLQISINSQMGGGEPPIQTVD